MELVSSYSCYLNLPNKFTSDISVLSLCQNERIKHSLIRNLELFNFFKM